MTKIFWLTVFSLSLVACGRGGSGAGSNPVPVPRPAEPTSPEINPQDVPVLISREDVVAIPQLRPTTYFLAQEKKIRCTGPYGRNSPNYTGAEKTVIRDVQGAAIATVCTRFSKVLNMEGSGILSDRGAGELTVNYAAKVGAEIRYRAITRCHYGEGVRPNLCLLPYHTVAADNKVHKIDEILFIPKAEGLRLPDGSLHDGFFIVRDTGKAFVNVGPSRVDLFTGVDPDNNNALLDAGFHHGNPMEAYKVVGKSAQLVRERLKLKFKTLY